MYLDSREATLFTQNMKGLTMLDAFFNAARRYQIESSTPVIARAMGYSAAINDRISTSYNYAPPIAHYLVVLAISAMTLQLNNRGMATVRIATN